MSCLRNGFPLTGRSRPSQNWRTHRIHSGRSTYLIDLAGIPAPGIRSLHSTRAAAFSFRRFGDAALRSQHTLVEAKHG